MTPRIRRLVGLVVALVAVALFAWMARPSPLPVETAPVTRGPLEVSIDEEGETRIHPRFVVAAPASGHLIPAGLDEGDAVTAGQIVAWLAPAALDPRRREQAEAELQTALAGQAEAEARVAEATAARDQAQSTLARQEQVAAAGQLTREELDRVRSAARTLEQALAATRFRAEAAGHAVETARAALLAADADSGPDPKGGEASRAVRLAVRAPAAGRVLRLYEDSERVVLAGTTILEIGDPANLEVVVDVLSTDAVSITRGAAMWLDAGGGKRLRAQVRLVEPAGFTKVSPLGVEEQRVNVVGELEERPPELGDRFRVAARILVWRGEEVLKAPAGAVFRSGETWAAFVLDGDRVRRREVSIGHRNPDEVEVLGGLEVGASVVLYPADELREGSRVVPLGR